MPSQRYEQALLLVQFAREQMHRGNFAGCVSTCETLLASLLGSSALRLEVLGLLGLACGMLQEFQRSYDVFSEAIDLDPTLAEFWYNRGLACFSLSRPGEAVLNLERAVALVKDEPGEMVRTFLQQLQEARLELQEAMQSYEPGITFEEYLEREKRFTQALHLFRQEKWQEAEALFRQLAEMGNPIPSYWGNLGVCLMMQQRYDEAEKALKQAIALDPDYPIARDNLKKLPEVRRSKQPPAHRVINLSRQEDEKQTLTLYEKGNEGEATAVVEKVGHAITSTARRLGKQPPRYTFLLNTSRDTRLTTCPQCKNKTRPRKFSLVVNVNPNHTVIVDKICRFCYLCNLLIVHQDQLEERLAATFVTIDPAVLGNDYQVVGTIERAEWKREKQDPVPFEQVIEYLHDFKAVLTFQ